VASAIDRLCLFAVLAADGTNMSKISAHTTSISALGLPAPARLIWPWPAPLPRLTPKWYAESSWSAPLSRLARSSVSYPAVWRRRSIRICARSTTPYMKCLATKKCCSWSSKISSKWHRWPTCAAAASTTHLSFWTKAKTPHPNK